MRKLTHRTLAMGVLTLAASSVALVSCKKSDDGPASLTVKSATTGGKDLSGATAATGVGLTSNVVIRFSREIDAATVTASSVALTPDGSTSAVAGSLTAGGDSVVFNPTNDLTSGTKYKLTLGSTIKAKDGGSYAGQSFTFTTFGPPNVTPPQADKMIAFFPFNGTFNDAKGAYTTSAIISTDFGADHKGNAGAAAVFNGTTSLVEIANGTNLITPSGTVSFWVKVDTTSGHGSFIMGANFFRGSQFEVDGKGAWIKNGANFVYGGDSTTTEDLFFNGDGKYNSNGGWQGHTFKASANLKQVLPDKWVHVIHTYNAANRVRTMYVNGQRVMESDFNLWPTGDSKQRVTAMKTQTGTDLSSTWAFGFGKGRDASFWADTDFGDYGKPGANHFKGTLDDVRFFSVALTSAEALTLYNAEK